MKRELKKGERAVLIGAQERSVLVFTINQYLSANQKKAKNNHVLRRDLTYLNKILGKLLRKRRCTNCGNWT